MHADPEWERPHYSGPIRVPLIVRERGCATTMELDLGLTQDQFGVWLHVAPVDSGGPVITMDPESSRRASTAALDLIGMLRE